MFTKSKGTIVGGLLLSPETTRASPRGSQDFKTSYVIGLTMLTSESFYTSENSTDFILNLVDPCSSVVDRDRVTETVQKKKTH